MEDKFYPLTYSVGKNISFLTQAQAIGLIKTTFEERSRQKLIFEEAERKSAEIDLSEASASLDYSPLITSFENQRKEGFLKHFKREVIEPKVSFNLEKQIDEIALSFAKEPKNAQVLFDESTGSAVISIKEAENGLMLDKEELSQIVHKALITGKYESRLPIKIKPPQITTEQAQKAKKILEKAIAEPVKLKFNDKVWMIDAKQLLTLLDLTEGKGLLNTDQSKAYLSGIAKEIDQEMQEGLFEFNTNTKRVTAFKASQDGQKLNTNKAITLLSEVLASEDKAEVILPVDVVKPKTATEDVNNLGIKELVGRGVSNFAGSIPNRIYNINLAASRINGVLIAPNQTFSFNATVGDITEATGFKKAYVIKEGRTVLDDGGGVCQVSTTIFRAVLNAGLPVVKRTAHAYRVSYYEQGFPPGLDATVFYPSVDFQFKNDTGYHILIQAYTAGTSLIVDLYGTSDGRTATLTKPVITNQAPPPPDLRQDDPTLPKGTVKQVDWAAWGATVTFQRTVTRGKETLLNETWKSVFKPWQAVYLVGTQ